MVEPGTAVTTAALLEAITDVVDQVTAGEGGMPALQRLVDIYDLRRREGPHRRAEQRAPHVHDERQVGKVDGCRVRVGVVEVGEPL